jgi:ADP-heptose:LPS heptosyltransferase
VIGKQAATGSLSAPRRVAILRALALGDLMCAVPALRAIRRAWPHAEITLFGLPSMREWSARFRTLVDRFMEFPGWPGLPEREPQLSRIPSFLGEAQAQRFDLVVQLHGSGTIVNSLVALIGGRQTAGFYPPGYYCPDAATFTPWPEKGLEIHRLLALIDHLGLPRAGDDLELPLGPDDFARLDALVESPWNLVVIHPGASTPLRRWPVERFAAVGRRLIDVGYQLVITGVTGEQSLAKQLTALVERPVIDLCGRTELGTLGALVSRAAVVLSNDTGMSHIAAAVQTPSVVISTGDNPARWAPINRRLHRVLCHANGVAVEEVLEATFKQLELCGGEPGVCEAKEAASLLA